MADPQREQARKDKQHQQQTAMATKDGLNTEIDALQRQIEVANPQLLEADIQRYC